MWNCAVANHCRRGHCLVKKIVFEGSFGKIVGKNFRRWDSAKKEKQLLGMLEDLTLICVKRTKKQKYWLLSTVCFVSCPEAKVVLTLLAEVELQDNEKLIYRWETKRVALLTSCWLPVEMYLLVVAFGFVAACHQISLGATDPFPRKLHWNTLTVTFA